MGDKLDNNSDMELNEFEKTIMPHPWKYYVVDTINRHLSYHTDNEPAKHELETYQPTDIPDVFKLKQTKVAYIDMRYGAKLRLYNYLKKKYGVPEPPRWADPETGKSKPILNF